MVMVDNERWHTDVNAAARLVFRMSQQEMRRLRIDDLTAEDDRPVMEESWHELLMRGTVSDRHLVTFRDGSTLRVFYAAIANALPARHLIVFAPAGLPGEELEEMQPERSFELRGALSARQLEVLRLVAVGASASEIADVLSISHATARTHVKNILERLGAHNRAHAVALAMGYGLLGDYDPEELTRLVAGRQRRAAVADRPQ